jgi:hypothetical protein
MLITKSLNVSHAAIATTITEAAGLLLDMECDNKNAKIAKFSCTKNQ